MTQEKIIAGFTNRLCAIVFTLLWVKTWPESLLMTGIWLCSWEVVRLAYELFRESRKAKS